MHIVVVLFIDLWLYSLKRPLPYKLKSFLMKYMIR